MTVERVITPRNVAEWKEITRLYHQSVVSMDSHDDYYLVAVKINDEK
ncbi:MAG: hypothetical protein AAB692_02550 [Patescibacteria group bacterium]